MANKKKSIPEFYGEPPESLDGHPFYGLRLDEEQQKFANAIWSPDIDIVFCNARAGTGKTTIATGVANLLIQYGMFSNLVYIMSPYGERKQGWLPGTITEKSSVYFEAFYQALITCGINPITAINDESMVNQKNGTGFITCITDTFLRGTNLDNRQSFQKLIYRLNQPFMRIDQTAFVNVSIFDRNYIESLFGGVKYPDGSYVIDCVEELIEHQKIFMEVVSQIRSENMFTFPVLTYSLLYKDGKFVDEDFARWCSDHNTTWNDSNFFISGDVTTLSNCCRLLSDTSKLNAFINSIGGTALSIGSVKVNTINLMRIALETECDEKKYLSLLKKRATLCCKTLDVVRHIIKRNVEKGLLPNYQDGAVEMDKQYCTMGILGLYEVIEAFGYTEKDEFGYTSYTDKGIEFACKIFEVLNEVKDTFTEEYSFNIESVPAERAAVILCQKDNQLYDRDEKFIYSNQWIPLSEKCTIKEKLRLSAVLDEKCSGGSIAHINLEANFPNTDVAWDMLNKIAQSGVIYFAFNTRINECKNHHGFVGTDICPTCGEPVYDTYVRIVGYLVPTRSFSKDRFKEFTTRQWYELAEAMNE